jgi:hypothetical protein
MSRISFGSYGFLPTLKNLNQKHRDVGSSMKTRPHPRARFFWRSRCRSPALSTRSLRHISKRAHEGPFCLCGGESGIRTREAGFSRLHTFQACSFNRSDTSPDLPAPSNIASLGFCLLYLAKLCRTREEGFSRSHVQAFHFNRSDISRDSLQPSILPCRGKTHHCELGPA